MSLVIATSVATALYIGRVKASYNRDNPALADRSNDCIPVVSQLTNFHHLRNKIYRPKRVNTRNLFDRIIDLKSKTRCALHAIVPVISAIAIACLMGSLWWSAAGLLLGHCGVDLAVSVYDSVAKHNKRNALLTIAASPARLDPSLLRCGKNCQLDPDLVEFAYVTKPQFGLHYNNNEVTDRDLAKILIQRCPSHGNIHEYYSKLSTELQNDPELILTALLGGMVNFPVEVNPSRFTPDIVIQVIRADKASTSETRARIFNRATLNIPKERLADVITVALVRYGKELPEEFMIYAKYYRSFNYIWKCMIPYFELIKYSVSQMAALYRDADRPKMIDHIRQNLWGFPTQKEIKTAIVKYAGNINGLTKWGQS